MATAEGTEFSGHPAGEKGPEDRYLLGTGSV